MRDLIFYLAFIDSDINRKKFEQLYQDYDEDVYKRQILKLPAECIIELAAPYSDVFPVNYNSPEQTAVAGKPEQLQAFGADVKAVGGRAVPLAVSGAFHSPYMDSAAEALADYVQTITIQEGTCAFYANYTAAVSYTHLSNRVAWRSRLFFILV